MLRQYLLSNLRPSLESMTVVTLGLHLIVRKLRTRKEHNQEANPFYTLLKRN